MKNKFQLFTKEQDYKNFRRNIIGSCIDLKYFSRNDHQDDENPVHNAFDLGHLTALEKIAFEFQVLSNLLKQNEKSHELFISEREKLLKDRIQITYCASINKGRSLKMQSQILKNQVRISDDM